MAGTANRHDRSMADRPSRFEPGTLWPTIVQRARRATACGALQPIQTELHVVEDQGVTFEVRLVSNLARKFSAPAPRSNPFLPYELDLFVVDVSDTHLCLLNKYNVIDNHTLIVTRAFEPQESPLTREDFEALRRCMAEYEALAFYNGGPVAGASQPHKHLQLVPLPLARDGAALPVAPLIPLNADHFGPRRLVSLPFQHGFVALEPAGALAPATGAAHVHERYIALLRAVGFDPRANTVPPYNLLITRRFMLLIPRARERLDGVSVNALGFAGSFFVSDRTSLDVIREAGPMTILREVCFPSPV